MSGLQTFRATASFTLGPEPIHSGSRMKSTLSAMKRVGLFGISALNVFKPPGIVYICVLKPFFVDSSKSLHELDWVKKTGEQVELPKIPLHLPPGPESSAPRGTGSGPAGPRCSGRPQLTRAGRLSMAADLRALLLQDHGV